MNDEPRLDEILVTSRPLANYLDFFNLRPSDLAGSRILDCPGGASSFTAEARRYGAITTAVDPTYNQAVTTFATMGREQIALSNDWFRNNPDLFLEAGQGDANISAIIEARYAALDTFLLDFEREPQHYVAGALPNLPFRDASFDLVLSSHLIFTYADRFDRAFHVLAIEEMLRVCSGEVRIYPLSSYLGVTADWFDDLLAELRDRGINSTIEDVPFRVTKNWTTQLTLSTGR